MRMHWFPRCAAVVTVSLAAAQAWAAPPIAPSPDVPEAGGVAPTALTTAADAATPPPLPLEPRPAAPSRAAPRPLPDWRLLAALGGAFAVLACYRFVSGRRVATLPPDVFEVLGEASLGGQQSVRVVRFGPRTLLVGVSAAGCHTLAELVDAQATEAIAAACRGSGRVATGPRREARS